MRFESLIIFRYLAALIVVIFHLGGNTTLVSQAPELLTAGPEMVTFFFVLSGFVMVIGYFKKDKIIAKAYWLKRFARILPGYFLALIIMIIFLRPSSDMGMMGTILSIFLLQAWIPPFPLFINLPAWAISVESFFYSIFPKLFNKIKKKSLNPSKLIFYSFILWLLTQILTTWLFNSNFYINPEYKINYIINYFPLIHLCSFILGMSGGYWFSKNKFKIQLPKLISQAIFISMLSIIFLILNNETTINNFFKLSLPFSSSLLAPIFLLFIFSVLIIKGTLIDKLLSLRPLVALGKISYSFYIFQYPIYAIVYKLLFTTTSLSHDYKFLIFILILTIFSFGFTYLIENPIIKMITRTYAQH